MSPDPCERGGNARLIKRGNLAIHYLVRVYAAGFSLAADPSSPDDIDVYERCCTDGEERV